MLKVYAICLLFIVSVKGYYYGGTFGGPHEDSPTYEDHGKQGNSRKPEFGNGLKHGYKLQCYVVETGNPGEMKMEVSGLPEVAMEMPMEVVQEEKKMAVNTEMMKQVMEELLKEKMSKESLVTDMEKMVKVLMDEVKEKKMAPMPEKDGESMLKLMAESMKSKLVKDRSMESLREVMGNMESLLNMAMEKSIVSMPNKNEEPMEEMLELMKLKSAEENLKESLEVDMDKIMKNLMKMVEEKSEILVSNKDGGKMEEMLKLMKANLREEDNSDGLLDMEEVMKNMMKLTEEQSLIAEDMSKSDEREMEMMGSGQVNMAMAMNGKAIKTNIGPKAIEAMKEAVEEQLKAEENAPILENRKDNGMSEMEENIEQSASYYTGNSVNLQDESASANWEASQSPNHFTHQLNQDHPDGGWSRVKMYRRF